MVEFDGVPYVWVHGPGPEVNERDITYTVNADVGKDFL
jgi:hypothetical protein